MPPPPLRLLRCIPHTSFPGFFAAFSSNVLPCMGEIIYIFYSYDAKTYIGYQDMVPSFWFRWWRPGFLITGMLYDVGMLAYCIYMDDITAVLMAVRLTIGLYQVSDQLWLVKHWVPFFVLKEKRRFIFLRLYLIGCIWFLVVGSTSWSGSWQERNEIFAHMYYLSAFIIIDGCGLWYLIKGGVDYFVKYRFHCARSLFGLWAFSGMILGIVGLSIGDGGGNNLVETLNYHSAFILIYIAFEFAISVVVHRFVVAFEELSWKYPNPIISPSTLSCNETTTFEATNGILSAASNKVVCDVDVLPSSIEGARTGSIPEDTDAVVSSSFNHNKVAIGDTLEGPIEEDGKEGGDVEAAHGLVSQSVGDAPSAISPPVTAPLTLADSIDVPYQAHRRFALAFDGITRRSSVFRGNILTHHIMMVKLKRHELVCRELDKIICVLYQMLMWEVVVWITQIFLTLYLQSVNTPAPPGSKGYYCQTPLENNINSAQFVNDFVFARR